jgi:hypothetical protein
MDRERFEKAVRTYWEVRMQQRRRQEKKGGKDIGTRSEVTGGKHMDALAEVLAEAFVDVGFSSETIYKAKKVELPGYLRPSKQWDLVVMHEDQIAAAIEFKSQVGSFGKNANNRTEEVIGVATDFWKAYEKGLLGETRPWIGYFLMLEEHAESTRPVATHKLDFPIEEAFADSSYKKRYEILCRRMVEEGLYDAACLVTSSADPATPIHEPAKDLGFDNFLDRIRERAEQLIKQQRLA